VRDALPVLNETLSDLRNAGGRKEEVDPVRHLIGTASFWGLNPDQDAVYLSVTLAKNDGATTYKLNVPGSVTAKKNSDGAVATQFGGCDGKIANCLPIMPGWNYTVRLYRPRPEILNGFWKFPEAQPLT
jgi:hypothetical protein